MKTLARIDNRLPITIALAHAFANGSVSSEQEGLWESELVDLVVESAKKFAGFDNVSSVREALNVVLGILSIGLLYQCKGKGNPELWVESLKSTKLKDLVKKAIALVAELIPEHYMGRNTTLEHLKHYATFFDRKGKTKRWIGYDEIVTTGKRVKEDGLSHRSSRDLAIWLIKELLGLDHKAFISRFLSKNSGYIEKDIPWEYVVRSIMFRFCYGLEVTESLGLEKKDFLKVRASYKKNPKLWEKKVSKKLNSLKEKVPKGIKFLTYDDQDWYDALVKGGPPIPPVNWDDALSGTDKETQGYLCVGYSEE